MKAILCIFLLLPFTLLAHPGIGIVKNSMGIIYYTDLHQVWKISNGTKSIAVPQVHTHELYIDAQDNLYGEHLYNNASGDTFYQYLWRLAPNGRLDTLLPAHEAYLQINFSLARDRHSNEYYTRRFLKRPNETHIYKKDSAGHETILARGNFKGVNWLHPQQDGSVLFVQNNTVYKVTPSGTLTTIAPNIGNAQPSFSFSGNNVMVWGVWQDAAANTYVAVFSDQAVKKVTPDGKISIYYQSKGNWAPLHGVFDNEGKLWVLESSDKNEIRAVQAHLPITNESKESNLLIISAVLFALALLLLLIRMQRHKAQQVQPA